MKADGYIRVSSAGGREGPSFISPDLQRESIKRTAAAKGWQLDEIVEELDVKGSTEIEDRELGRLVRKIEARETGALLVYLVARYSRDQVNGILTAARIRKAGGHIVGEDLDTSAPSGRAMLGFLLGRAEEELEQRRDVWRASKRKAFDRGVWLAKIPYGFVKADDGCLHPDPEAAAIVLEAFRVRDGGRSYAQICDWLEQETGRPWAVPTVRGMLRNHVYIGVAEYDEWRNEKAHDPIVPRALFDAVQAARATESRTPLRRAARGRGAMSGQTLLNGLLFCSCCGYRMQVVRSSSLLSRKTGERSAPKPRYACKEHRCAASAGADGAKLDAYVEAVFLQALREDRRLLDVVATEQRVIDLEAKVEAAEAELRTYVSSNLISVLGEAEFTRGAEVRQGAVDTARRELADARQRCSVRGRLPSGPLFNLWPTLDLIERRRVLAGYVDRIVVARGRVPLADRVRVVWHGEEADVDGQVWEAAA